MSAEIRLASGDGDAPFRPEYAVYGEGSLRLPVCLSRGEAGADGADTEDSEGKGAGVDGSGAKNCEGKKASAGGGDGKSAEDCESERDGAAGADGADAEIIVRVIDIFGAASIMKLKLGPEWRCRI
jgi:hypothetical protein